MATVLQQVLDRLDVILKARVPAGCNVFRSRSDAQSRAEAPSVNVLAKSGTVDPISEMDRHEDLIDLSFYTREEPGDVQAESLHAAVHSYIVQDPVLAALCEGRRLIENEFDNQEADSDSTLKRARYRFTYLIPFNTL